MAWETQPALMKLPDWGRRPSIPTHRSNPAKQPGCGKGRERGCRRPEQGVVRSLGRRAHHCVLQTWRQNILSLLCRWPQGPIGNNSRPHHRAVGATIKFKCSSILSTSTRIFHPFYGFLSNDKMQLFWLLSQWNNERWPESPPGKAAAYLFILTPRLIMNFN